MNKYHYYWHDGKEGFILADELRLVNTEREGNVRDTRHPIQSWIFYRAGEKYREMPVWMIHGEPELIPDKERKE